MTNKKIANKIKTAIQKINKEIAQELVNHFQDNFARQGFAGKKWQPRKQKEEENPSSSTKKRKRKAKRKSENRGILIGKGSGKLLRSIDYSQIKNGKIRFTSLHYGKFHNEGIEPQPKRQFMGIKGDSLALYKIKKIAKKHIKNIFK